MKPKDAKSFADVCSLKTDAHDTAGAWICIDWPTIVIHKQRVGEEPTGHVTLTRREFQAFVDRWEGRRPVERKRRKRK